MRIISYEYYDTVANGWSFSKVELGRVNLLVGDSGSGKTRFLNTVFNLSATLLGTRRLGPHTHWKLTFEHHGDTYGWDIRTGQSPDGAPIIEKERLWQETRPGIITIVKRNRSAFVFLGKPIPRPPSDTLSLSLLREEDKIRHLYLGFSTILRRNFFSDALGTIIPIVLPATIIVDKPVDTLLQLHSLDLPLNPKLLLLSRYFPNIYDSICSNFTAVFPFIQSVEIKDVKGFASSRNLPLGIAPVFCVKKRYVNRWIGIDQLSSGMQKVLLIITDASALPDGGIYLIDEYENSLGINAIDFLPKFLASLQNDVQFIFTSHHPNIINNIPVEYWLVFSRIGSRRGSKVNIRYGERNVEVYGKSKQQRFTQLINDPFYTEGIERIA